MKYWSANLSPRIPEGKMLSVATPRVRTCVWANGHIQGLQCREGSDFSPRCLCSRWRCWAWHREGDYLWLSSCRVHARFSIPRVVSNLVTQPCLPPTPSRYLHLPLSNHFFLWLLKLTHFDILRGEKWEVLLEIALMCCTGEALFEEQAMRVLSELYFYVPFNTSLFYFVLNKNSRGCLSYRKKKTTQKYLAEVWVQFISSNEGQACIGKKFMWKNGINKTIRICWSWALLWDFK